MSVKKKSVRKKPKAAKRSKNDVSPEQDSPGSTAGDSVDDITAEITRDFKNIRRRLLGWFRKNQRDYPWRRTGNWFHLLMAEMMLRRTRADQVRPVYENFTGRFKDPTSASRLKKKELETMLAPLGLHWRASQVHETIQFLRDNYAKRAPGKEDNFQEIPGVGDYSEAMLRNRLFNEPRAAIDANVIRVILRWQGKPYKADSRRDKDFIKLANAFVKSKNSKELNLALLDFSALLCRPRNPDCEECPVSIFCKSRIDTPAKK